MALEFILERYNYWIVIVLMMTGLYIVFSRGNLVKKVVGLNLFQTSVFIFYITIGKIVNGTAPIIIGGEDHGAGGAHETPIAGENAAEAAMNPLPENGAAPLPSGESLHDDKIANAFAGVKPNSLSAAPPNSLREGGADPLAGTVDSLHAEPGKIANDIAAAAKQAGDAGVTFDIAGAHVGAAAQAGDHGMNAAGHAAADIIYTNPLPHVLILTAIVVGVATTAVGLALAVRVREAYGTIEEDELEAADDIAEFGAAAGKPAGAAS